MMSEPEIVIRYYYGKCMMKYIHHTVRNLPVSWALRLLRVEEDTETSNGVLWGCQPSNTTRLDNSLTIHLTTPVVESL